MYEQIDHSKYNVSFNRTRDEFQVYWYSKDIRKCSTGNSSTPAYHEKAAAFHSLVY